MFIREFHELYILIREFYDFCIFIEESWILHFIKEINGGIEMEDIVDYKIPFGILGQIAHPLFVKNKLRQIFKFREKKLIKLFGKL